MTADQCSIDEWVQRVKAEYLEMPGLQLTKPQIQRLWSLEPWVADALLDTLIATDFLKRTSRDAYVLAHGISR